MGGLWSFSLAEELAEGEFEYAAGPNCCWSGDRIKWYALLNNSEEIHAEIHHKLRGYGVTLNDDGSLRFATEEELEYKPAWCEAYAKRLKAKLVRLGWIEKGIFEGRVKKVVSELKLSTSWLSVPEQPRWWQNKWCCSSRTWSLGWSGLTGCSLVTTTWRCLTRRTGGCGTTCSLMLGGRPDTSTRAKWASSYLNVVDSLVSRGGMSRGRNPSKGINRLLLGSDQYPLIPWTISRWKFPGGASRRRVLPDAKTP